MSEIIIVISPEGEPSIEVLQGDGKTCTDLTKQLEQALGTIEERKFKPEHRQAKNATGVRLKA